MLIISILYNTNGETRSNVAQNIKEYYDYLKTEFDNKCKIIFIPVKDQPT